LYKNHTFFRYLEADTQISVAQHEMYNFWALNCFNGKLKTKINQKNAPINSGLIYY